MSTDDETQAKINDIWKDIKPFPGDPILSINIDYAKDILLLFFL